MTKCFGQQQLVMVNYACGFNQSETGNILNNNDNVYICHDEKTIELRHH